MPCVRHLRLPSDGATRNESPNIESATKHAQTSEHQQPEHGETISCYIGNITSHHITSHITSHPILSHPIPSHHVASQHPITSHPSVIPTCTPSAIRAQLFSYYCSNTSLSLVNISVSCVAPSPVHSPHPHPHMPSHDTVATHTTCCDVC